ncbi:P-loop containing nucleoside triphosphate hydrolase protein [Fennellomyces sp. T-0311]|nr:P-loop containing nucleoside triphosphate hydrolase protein [Fennellomyces sp. T-0311]
MAAYQATGLPSVSLPTVNYQLQESVLPLLERFSKIYLWLDDDVDGQIAAERFANKLGKSRCLLVNTNIQNESDGPRTAHEAWIQGRDLAEIVQSARRIRHDEIMNFHDLREEVLREVMNPEQTRGGHRPGELTILTGPTGAGKTTIISQLSLDYCKSGVPTLWGSFEILNKRLAKKMLYQLAGKDLSKAPQEFDVWADQFEQLPLHFLKFFSTTAIKDVLKACKHAVYAYDIRHIILDNLQFMLSQQGRSSLDRWELQDEAVAELRKFATEQDVHITLVVHPRKDAGDALEINSVFGSAKVTQEADNVVIIQKGEQARYLDIKKNRHVSLMKL